MRKRAGVIFVCAAFLVAMAVGTASASSVATTKHATSITDGKAVLHGLLVTGGTDAAWFFQWGTTRDLGSQSRTRAISPDNLPQSVELKITHLRPNTTYYFRFVVIVGGYIATPFYGSIEHFKTEPRD